MISHYAYIKMAYLYNGILSRNEKEGIAGICNCEDESQKLIEREKLDRKEYILYDSVYMMFLNKQNLSKVKTIWIAIVSVGVGGEDGGMKELSGEMEMSISIWVSIIWIYTFVKLVELYTSDMCILLQKNYTIKKLKTTKKQTIQFPPQRKCRWLIDIWKDAQGC